MDTNQFVLICAVFMVVATVMLTTLPWQEKPTPQSLLQYACRFDRFCMAGNCAAPLPPGILIWPEAEGGSATFGYADNKATRLKLDKIGPSEWVGQTGTSRMMRLSLRENGALTYTETAGSEPDSAVLASGTGICRPVTETSREQG